MMKVDVLELELLGRPTSVPVKLSSCVLASDHRLLPTK